jgi:hypothetical protein
MCPCTRHKGILGSTSITPLIRNLRTRCRLTSRTAFHWTGSWVGSKNDLDTSENRNTVPCLSDPQLDGTYVNINVHLLYKKKLWLRMVLLSIFKYSFLSKFSAWWTKRSISGSEVLEITVSIYDRWSTKTYATVKTRFLENTGFVVTMTGLRIWQMTCGMLGASAEHHHLKN